MAELVDIQCEVSLPDYKQTCGRTYSETSKSCIPTKDVVAQSLEDQKSILDNAAKLNKGGGLLVQYRRATWTNVRTYFWRGYSKLTGNYEEEGKATVSTIQSCDTSSDLGACETKTIWGEGFNSDGTWEIPLSVWSHTNTAEADEAKMTGKFVVKYSGVWIDGGVGSQVYQQKKSALCAFADSSVAFKPADEPVPTSGCNLALTDSTDTLLAPNICMGSALTLSPSVCQYKNNMVNTCIAAAVKKSFTSDSSLPDLGKSIGDALGRIAAAIKDIISRMSDGINAPPPGAPDFSAYKRAVNGLP